jgi:hypothetical protein
MKRSFRVAAVFTGAAAAVAGFAPVAGAVTIAPGAAPGITPDIHGGNCSSAPNSSVHLYYESSQHHARPACFNGDGTWPLGKGIRFVSYCAGAFSGYLYIGGTPKKFTAGTHKLYGASVSKVMISKYSHYGSRCPSHIIIV